MAISTAVTIVDPSRVHVIVPEPVGLPDKIAQAYTQAMEQMQSLLETPEVQARFAHVMLAQLRGKPTLFTCTPQSIVLGIISMAEHGLDPSVQNECWLVPYKGEATMQTGYGGLMKLAMSHPDVLDIWADEVCENDTYEYYGVNARPKHIYPAKFAPRGRYVGYYAVALLSGNRVRAVQKSIEEIKAHAKRFSPRWDKESWSEDRGGGFRGMALKTVLRMICNTKYLPMAGKVAALLRTMETLEGTIDTEIDEQRAQERQRLEAGNTVEDHIEHLTGVRPKNGAIYDHTPSTQGGSPHPPASGPTERILQGEDTLGIEVQITDLLYAQGHDDAGIEAWWQRQRARTPDLSPGVLNYCLEQLQGRAAQRSTSPSSASTATDETLLAFRALTEAQQALGWTGQEVKAWERRQARRFHTTYTKFSVEMLRALVDELEALQAMQDPTLDTTPHDASATAEHPESSVATSVATMPNSSPSSEEEHVRAFPPDECGSIREDLAWFVQGLEDVTLKAEALALINDPMTPLDVLIKKRADVQDRLAQERLVPEDAEQGLPF